MSQHSAEFLRGAKWAINQGNMISWDGVDAMLTQAEAREAGEPDAAAVIAQCKRAVLQIGKWEYFSPHEKQVARAALAAIAAWEASRGK